MDTETAVKNIDALIAQSRMTRPDHVVLQQSLEYLKNKAIELDEEDTTGKPKEEDN